MNKSKEIIAKRFAFLAGLFLIFSGLIILLLPDLTVLLYDLPSRTFAESPMTFGMGIRQFAFGLIVLGLLRRNQLHALGLVLVILAIIPFTDFFIFESISGWFSALRHLISVPVLLVLGIYLLKHDQ